MHCENRLYGWIRREASIVPIAGPIPKTILRSHCMSRGPSYFTGLTTTCKRANSDSRAHTRVCTCSNVPDHTMFLPAICLAAAPGDRPDCCICCKSRARLSSHDIPRGAALHPSDSAVPDPLPASPASFSASLPADPGPHLGKRERGAALERALSSTLNWEGACCATVSEQRAERTGRMHRAEHGTRACRRVRATAQRLTHGVCGFTWARSAVLHPDGQPPQQREALARVVLRQTRSSGHHAPCSQRAAATRLARTCALEQYFLRNFGRED